MRLLLNTGRRRREKLNSKPRLGRMSSFFGSKKETLISVEILEIEILSVKSSHFTLSWKKRICDPYNA